MDGAAAVNVELGKYASESEKRATLHLGELHRHGRQHQLAHELDHLPVVQVGSVVIVEERHGFVEARRARRVLSPTGRIQRRPVPHEHCKVEGWQANREHNEHEPRSCFGRLLLRGIAQDAQVLGQVSHLQCGDNRNTGQHAHTCTHDFFGTALTSRQLKVWEKTAVHEG